MKMEDCYTSTYSSQAVIQSSQLNLLRRHNGQSSNYLPSSPVCTHPEDKVICDIHEGTYICTICGTVVSEDFYLPSVFQTKAENGEQNCLEDQLFSLSQEMSMADKTRSSGGGGGGDQKPGIPCEDRKYVEMSSQWKISVTKMIHNLCSRQHIPDNICWEAGNFFSSIIVPKLVNSRHFSVLDVATFAIFSALEKHDVHKTFSDMQVEFGGKIRSLLSLSRLLAGEKCIYINEHPPSKFADTIFARFSLPFKLQTSIKRLADAYYQSLDGKSSLKPQTILAACTYVLCNMEKKAGKFIGRRVHNTKFKSSISYPAAKDLSLKVASEYFQISTTTICRLGKEIVKFMSTADGKY